MDGAGTIPVKKRTSLLIRSILLNLLLVVASWATVLHYYPLLPKEVPMHYGLQGPPDSWGDKSAIFSVPAVQTGLVTLLLVISSDDALPLDVQPPCRFKNAFGWGER